MAGKKVHKYLILPKGYERASVVPRTKNGPHNYEFDYDKKLQEDFEAHRASYIEVEMYGVPVLVKVKPKDASST